MFFDHQLRIVQRLSGAEQRSFDICHCYLCVMQYLTLLKGSVAAAFSVGIVGRAGDPIGLIVDFLLELN